MKANRALSDYAADLKRAWNRSLLRVVFVVRVLTSFSAAWVLAGATPTFAGLGVPFIVFAFADGILAIVMASLAFNTRLLRGKFVAAAFFDGIVLLAASVTLVMRAGIPGSGVLLALYVGVAATCFSVVGVVQLLVSRRVYQRLGGNVLSIGLVIAGLTSAALGTATLFMPPNAALAKQFLVAVVVLQGVALVLPAVNTWPAATELQAGDA